MQALRVARLFLSLAVGLGLLAACATGGGGGGGGGGPPAGPPPPPAPPPPPPPPPSPPPPPGSFPPPTSAEFLANWGPNFINAEEAWERGFTGDGVTVGVIDDGIHPNHPELAGRISPDSTDIVPGRNALVTNNSHGSELSSLIAGNFNGQQTVGVAFGATILAIRADNGNRGFAASDLAAALDYAVAHDVDIVNFSLGGSVPLGREFEEALTRATNAGVIVVVSAGNDGGVGATQVNYPGRYATNPNISHGLVISAGGLNSNGFINTVSNPPGSAANWYLSAPGWEIIVPDYGPSGPVPGFQVCGPDGGLSVGLCRIQGTSYASPHIAGALALLRQAFPGMTPAELVDLILTTAFDAGAPGIDSVYGRGILDVARAFQPVGTLMLATAAGGDVPVSKPVGLVGGAFGDAFARNPEAWTATSFDKYRRSYDVTLAPGWIGAAVRDVAEDGPPVLWRIGAPGGPISASFASAEPAPPEALLRRLTDEPQGAVRMSMMLGEDVRVSIAKSASLFDEDAAGAANAHLAFAGARLSIAATRFVGSDARLSIVSQSSQADLGGDLGFGRSERRATAVRFEDAFGPLDATLTYGVVREQGAALGLAWSSDWGGEPNGATDFGALALGWSFSENLRLAASAELGHMQLDGGGWLKLDKPLLTSAGSFGVRYAVIPETLAQRGLAGAFSLSISQPLRVEEGHFLAVLPTSDRWGRAHLAFVEREIPATPSGREIETRFAYWLWWSDRLSARAEASHRAEPGHRADSDDIVEALIGLRMTY